MMHPTSMPNVGAINLSDIAQYLGGKPTQSQVMASTGKLLNDVTFNKMPKTVGRFAGQGLSRGFARAVPVLSLGTNLLDVGDIILGDESFGNKAMDATAMAAGAAIGGFMGGGIFSPLTASIGASAGKSLSDATQWLFGDKKTAEQRRMEEALVALQGRGLV